MRFAKLASAKCPVTIPIEAVGNGDRKGNRFGKPPGKEGQIAQEQPQQSLIDDRAAGADDAEFDELT